MKSKSRALFIDLLRGLALLVMIEVHVVNAFVYPEIKDSFWFPALNFINGLVAPSFLFVSGLVFVLSLQKGVEELRNFGGTFWKKINRILLILLAGYSLHTPYYSLRKILANPTPEVLKQLFTVDILQVISIGLLILLFARMIFKTEKSFYIFVGSFLLFVLLFSPIAWETDFNKFMPIPLASFFNRNNGSLFPVFPWFNFLFAGALTSKFYLQFKERIAENIFIRKILFLGIGFFIVCVLLLNLLLPPSLEHFRPHPLFFLERLGIVFALLAGCWYSLQKKENYSSFILDVSRESLLVYWLHLQVIYRKIFWGKSLEDMFGGKLNLLECALFTLALCTLMVFTAIGWGWIKSNYPKLVPKLVLAAVIIGIFAFVTRQY